MSYQRRRYGLRGGGDPYWTEARFNSRCAGQCNSTIQRGSRIFYFPNGRSAYCERCGEAHAARFAAERFDEEHNRCM